MVQVSTALVAVLSYSSFLSVSGSPVIATEQNVALNGNTVAPTLWRGVLEEGNPPVYLSGSSYDDIEAQAKALNPAYTIYAESNSTDINLKARAVTSVYCGWPKDFSPTSNFIAVVGGIEYLHGLKGDCGVGAGPGVCARVSCSWGAAIYFCNNNSHAIYEPCRWIGDTAAEIYDLCVDDDFSRPLLGQAFIDRNWNTIIGAGNC